MQQQYRRNRFCTDMFMQLGIISVSYRFCRVRWIVCTVHPILSARELHFHMEADSLNRRPIRLSRSPSLSLLSWPFRCFACTQINSNINRDSLSWRFMHHLQDFGPFLTPKVFFKKKKKERKKAAMILCQWSCRQTGLLLAQLAALSSSAQTS